jgi:hypothetical protein
MYGDSPSPGGGGGAGGALLDEQARSWLRQIGIKSAAAHAAFEEQGVYSIDDILELRSEVDVLATILQGCQGMEKKKLRSGLLELPNTQKSSSAVAIRRETPRMRIHSNRGYGIKTSGGSVCFMLFDGQSPSDIAADNGSPGWSAEEGGTIYVRGLDADGSVGSAARVRIDDDTYDDY